MAKKSWFTVTAAAKGGVPEVLIYDEIGAWGVTPTSFYQALKDLGLKAGDKANLRLNSPGGDVFAGNNIYNMLLDTEAEWTVHVDGVAASMASLIATLPGAHVVIAANAFIMIHNPAAWASGESKDMKRTAALLDSIRDTMIRAYSEKSGLDEDEIGAMLDAETWLDADEAIRLGFADSKGAENRLAAKFDLRARFSNAPAAASAIPAKPTESDLAAALAENNKGLAEAIVSGLAAALVPKPITVPDAAATDLGTYKAYVAEVNALCALKGLPGEAAAFVATDTPLAEVRTRLHAKKAAANRGTYPSLTARIDTHGVGVSAESTEFDPDAIWARLRK